MDSHGAQASEAGPFTSLSSVWSGSAGGASTGLDGRVSYAPVSRLDFSAALESLKDLAELRSWVDAQEAKAVTRVRDLAAELVGFDAPLGMANSLAAAEIGCVLQVPERSAATLIERSQLLTVHYRRTLEALERGRLSKRHAWAVVEESTGVPDEASCEFESRLITVAEEATVAKLGYRARKLREELHPESLKVRRHRAMQDRHVELTPERDGMAWLSAYLPVEQAAGIYQRLDAGARGVQGASEPRTLSQLRADVFMDVLTHTCRGDVAAGTGFRSVQAQVFITVPVMTLLGTSEGPGELDGYGPIDAETARGLAAHAPSFIRILTHPGTGAVLDVGRDRYRPPKDLQNWVRVRDKTCRHPGCNRLAANSELDHTVPWGRDGVSAHGNLCSMCKRHHMFKSEGYWHYEQPEPGLIKATSLAGKTYTTLPEPPPF